MYDKHNLWVRCVLRKMGARRGRPLKGTSDISSHLNETKWRQLKGAALQVQKNDAIRADSIKYSASF